MAPAPSPEKNRFRIYFASPVERGEGISLKAYLAGKLDGDSLEDEARDDEEAEMESGDDFEGQHDEEVEEELLEDHEDHENQEVESFGDPYDQERLDPAESGNAQAIDQAEAGHDRLEDEAPEGDDAESEGKDALEVPAAPQETAVETEEDPGQKAPDEATQGDADVSQSGQPEAAELADVSMMTAEGDGAVETQADGAVETEVKQSDAAKPESPTAGGVPTDSAPENAPADAAEQAPTNGEDSAETVKEEGDRALAEAQKVALQASAQNTSAAYGARTSRQPAVKPSSPLSHSMTDRPFRRSPSAPPTSSDVPVPTPNRLSILYADGTRRIVLDAAIVEHVQIHRKRGMIKVRIGGFKQAVHEKQVESLAKKTGEMNVAVSAGEGVKGDAPPEGESSAVPAQEGEKADETEKPKSPVQGILVRYVVPVCTVCPDRFTLVSLFVS